MSESTLPVTHSTAPTSDGEIVAPPAVNQHGEDSVIIRVPVEIVRSVADDVDVADPQIGQVGKFEDELYGPDGKQIGTSSGSFRIEFVRPTDGGLLTYYSEEITFADGVVKAEGWADFNDVKTSKWVYYPATGVSGRYAGKTGFRAWRMTGVRASAEARILLADS